jgi:predicted  nucleic acid-binding Zn-ribbon protein
MIEKELLTLAVGIIVVVLLPVIGYLVKTRVDRLEGDVNALGAKVNKNREEMLTQYVSYDRLRDQFETALKPIDEGIHRLESGMTEIFRKLDQKADKP